MIRSLALLFRSVDYYVNMAYNSLFVLCERQANKAAYVLIIEAYVLARPFYFIVYLYNNFVIKYKLNGAGPFNFFLSRGYMGKIIYVNGTGLG